MNIKKPSDDSLSKLAHATSSDPVKARDHFPQNVERPSQTWEKQNPLLDQWKLLEASANLTGHEVKPLSSKDNKLAKNVATATGSMFRPETRIDK
ncbi:MAG: hypothetical protein Q8L98_02615 [Chlamydiales bacterium]|nr:hypothetical protein [Chlamydiales bacterium]